MDRGDLGGDYQSHEAKESHKHEWKPLKQDGVAERLDFLKGSVHCMKWDDPAAFSAAGNCMFCVCFACSLWPRMCFSSQHLALSLLWVFWFVLSCSFLLFVDEAQARAACCPFDDISAQLMLARLWNRSSCNVGPPQQVSHPASVPSPCTHPEEPVCLQCHECNSSQPEVICNLPPVTLSHRREERLDSLSYGKYSGSRLPLAFPHLDTSSAKHFNRVCWTAVYSPLPPPTWQKTSLWHWRFFPEEVSTVWSGVGCFDITYLWQILKILVKNHDSGGRILFFLFSFCKLCHFSSEEICTYDGERVLFFPPAKWNATF